MRNLRSELMALALGLMCSTTCFAQDLTMDGLIETESVTVTRDNYRVEHKIDETKLDKELADTDKLIAHIEVQYKAIFTNAERDEADVFRTWEKDRYTAMKQAAASFENRMKELNEKLVAVEALFKVASKERLPREVHIAILERAGHFTRNVTIYNTFVDFGVNRGLRFDTMTPFNELLAKILEPSRTKYVGFPEMILPYARTASVNDSATVEGGVVHERSSLTVTNTVVHFPLDQAKLSEILSQASKEIKKASDAREAILGAGIKETTRYKYRTNRKSIEYECELNVFEETHKPKIIDYVFAMIRLKGLCNELTARLSISKNYVADLNVRSEWKQVQTRFAELATWGDTWIVTYDPWNKVERWFKFFPGGGSFTQRHIFAGMKVLSPTEVAELAARNRRLVEMKNSGMMSSDDVLRLLKSIDYNYRYGKAKDMAPRIYDLTPNNIIRIGETFDYNYRDNWLTFAMKLPNFKSSN